MLYRVRMSFYFLSPLLILWNKESEKNDIFAMLQTRIK